MEHVIIMVKKAALSVRIKESTKAALEKAAAKDRRSVSSLVEILLADATQAQRVAPKKYLDLDEQLGAGGNLMDALLPTGKTVGDSTREELEAVAKAYAAAGEKLQARVKKLGAKAKR